MIFYLDIFTKKNYKFIYMKIFYVLFCSQENFIYKILYFIIWFYFLWFMKSLQHLFWHNFTGSLEQCCMFMFYVIFIYLSLIIHINLYMCNDITLHVHSNSLSRITRDLKYLTYVTIKKKYSLLYIHIICLFI